jgi:hypothetical protein
MGHKIFVSTYIKHKHKINLELLLPYCRVVAL